MYFFNINCQFVIQFKNNNFATIQINNHFNTDYINIKNYLLFHIDSCRYGDFIFDNIFNMEITMISCRCNMNYKYYLNNPMYMLERRINYIISRNPYLINCLNRNKNHPLIRNYIHINEYNKYYR